MRFFDSARGLFKAMGILCLLSSWQTGFAQSPDSTEKVSYFGGSINLTNNGISFLPSFSLGKPAVIFNMTAGRKLTFEPEFRVALEGKPWAFIFWWRYRFFNDQRFRLRVGAHPSVLFATLPVNTGMETRDMLVARRYLAAELSPDYYLTDHISLGMYYLKGHGFQDDAVVNTDFITLNCKITNIPLFGKLLFGFYPQFYYLRMDGNDGFYFSSTQALSIQDFPLTFQSIINHPFESDIPGGQDFVWNVSLIYSFGGKYAPLGSVY